MRIAAARIALALAVLAGLAVPAAAVPVPGGSPNVELVAQFPDIQTMGGRFIGRHLYTTATDGLRVYDTADPLLPVLVSTLPLPTFSNEDVTVSNTRKLALLSSDWGGFGLGGALFVVDVVNPALPRLVGMLPYNGVTNPDGSSFDRVGHIANCINDCARYAWITGADSGRMLVVDLQNPAAPRAAGWVSAQANPGNATVGTKLVHDVYTDPAGDVWVFGSQGISKVDAGNPLAPVERYSITKADNDRLDQLVMHNGMRLDARTLVVTEEDWIQPQCKAGDEGSLQTWEIPTTATGTLKPLDQWTTELGTFVDGGTPVSVACSAHWFDINSRGIAAVAWYHQGVRFLDVKTNPRAIRQVGYYIPPWEVAGPGVSMALYVPGRDDLVYAMSLTSGLIVLRIAGGGAGAPTVVAPISPAWIGERTAIDFRPHPTFGWACPIA